LHRHLACLGLVIAISCATDGGTGDATVQSLPCGEDHTLSGAGVGDFRVGATVEDVRARCDVVLDTLLQAGAEGMPEQRLAVTIGADTVQATIVSGRVWRIEVRSPRFRTRDSLGVGSTVADLKKQPLEYLGFGEGGPFVALPAHCGMSFSLAGVPGTPRTIDRVPPEARVDLVLLLGCD
jgi:hypothetical protein